MTTKELEAAILQANRLTDSSKLASGSPITIPGMDQPFAAEKPQPSSRHAEYYAIYLTGTMADSEHGIAMVRRWHDLGGNAVVFDIKDSDGSLSIPFDHRLAPSPHRVPISNLPKFIHFLHSLNMHAIARIALFRDERMVRVHPELAVQSRRSGQPWRENGKLVWTDSSNPQIQDYNLALAQHVARSGADEVQFDYVRFPAEGDQADAVFAFQKSHPAWKRTDAISDFVARAYAALHPAGVLLSLDVFGVVAWQRSVDLAHIGQDIVQLATHCDVLSPMIYPSHFFGMDGYASPGNAPEHFIGESMQRFRNITAASGVVLRPWLQAFAWRTSSYSPEYILRQVGASRQQGGVGFLLWNARNDYARPFAAMPQMRARADLYLGTRHDFPAGVGSGSSSPADRKSGAGSHRSSGASSDISRAAPPHGAPARTLAP